MLDAKLRFKELGGLTPESGARAGHLHGWTKEFRLVAALCQWPAAKIDAGSARNAASGLDWPLFLATVQRQRVEGLVNFGLKTVAIEPPAPVAAILARRAARIARDNLAQSAESLRLMALLRAERIEPLFLKGATLAVLAYGTLSVKHSRDIDIIVPPAQALAAIAILRGEGYEFADAGFHEQGRLERAIEVLYELELRHPQKGTMIELHWRLFDFEHLLSTLYEHCSARSVPFGASSLPTFGDDDLFTYLCVHCARHGWARLKWLADFNALVSNHDQARVEQLYEGAVAYGAGRAAAVTLLLCADLFGLELREAFARRLQSDRWTGLLIKLACDILSDPVCLDERPIAKIKLEAAQLLLGSGWRHVAAVIFRQWSGTNERLAFPLPRGLSFLYGVIRPPLWLWRRCRTLVPVIWR